VFDEDTVCGFIGVIMYAVADMQCSKSFFSLSGEKTGRKSHACRAGIDGSIINDFNSARGFLQEISR